MHTLGVLAVVYTVVFGLRASSLALCDGSWGEGCMEDIAGTCSGEGEVEPWMALLYVVGLCGLLGTQTVAAGMCYHLYAGSWPSGIKVVDEVRLQAAPKEETKPTPHIPANRPAEEPIKVVTLRDPNVQRILQPANPKPRDSPKAAQPTSYISTRQVPEAGSIINPNGEY